MPKVNWFYRNMQAQDNLELLLVSAASSLLLLRFGLHVAGYPQVGGGNLHIAHMLYGGLLLLAAVVIQISFLGKRAQRASALIGGAGFGVFIDELGKFITRDNNYFFRPTVGIIYAIFIMMYLLFNFIGRQQLLSSREYQLNALNEMQEAVLRDMSEAEKRHIAEILAAADQKDVITKHLQAMLATLMPVKQSVHPLRRFQQAALRKYQYFWHLRGSNQLVSIVFIVQTLIFVVAIFISLASNFHSLDESFNVSKGYGHQLLIGQLMSSVVAAIFACIGALQLPHARMRGYEWFRRATLVTIFLTEFFTFSRIEFAAMPGFIVNILLLACLDFAITQEKRSTLAPAKVE